MSRLQSILKSCNYIFALFLITSSSCFAVIPGVTGAPVAGGVQFNLNASSFNIPTPDGDSVMMWGYADGAGAPQYPGPTMIVTQGDIVTITLTNQNIPQSVSMLFPGQEGVAATGGTAGLLTNESATGGADTVTYTFTASKPGTYTYYSGTKPGLQVEMGLMGVLIVRPATTPPVGALGLAYGSADTTFDREYLYVLSSIDPTVHYSVEFGNLNMVNNTISHSTLWFVNGRNAPDTLFPNNNPFMPNQPYGSLGQMHPGEDVLMRVVGGGREMHPLHTHGANYRLIARDGRVLSSDQNPASPAPAADLAVSDNTLQVVPGSTYDAIWTWTGEGLGWDVYGTTADGVPHGTCGGPGSADDLNSDGFHDTTHEYCADHEIAIPVIYPENQQLAFGGFYSGSPFLGALSSLPPGEGGLNLNGGMFHIWHSHNEKELANTDVFPGGMLTFMIVEHPNTPIP